MIKHARGGSILEFFEKYPLGAIFDEIYFVLCHLDLSDNLTRIAHHEKPDWTLKSTSIVWTR